VLLNHLAAILFFAGPLFYCGMWMAIDPTGFANLLELAFRRPEVTGKIRTGIRWAGVVMVLVALAL
jgi:hypothetical protein